MFRHMLFFRLFEPENDLGGGAGGADLGGGDAGGGSDAGGDAGGGGSAPTMDDTARNTYRALMKAGGGEDLGDDDAGGDAGDDQGGEQARHKSQPRVKGKFAKAGAQQQQQQQQGGEGGEGQGGEGDQGGDDQQQQQQTQQHDAFPNTWRKDLAEKWATLDPEVRAEIHKREQDFHAGVRQYKDAAGFGSQVAQVMQPYQRIMQEKGVHPVGIVKDIMGALNVMATGSEESKAAQFLQLAQSYGINLDTVLSLRQRAPGQAAPDLSPVLQRVQQIETRISQADQEREQRQREEDEARVTSFINDPKNEHAKAVSKQMAALLLSGEAQDMPDAYQKAIWLHPETRAKLLQKQEADRRKREADEATAARKAGAATVQRRGTPPAAGKPASMDDTARSIYRKLVPG